MNTVPSALDILRRQPLFSRASDEDVARVAEVARRRRWPASNVIFQRGDDGQEMILVTEGRVRLSVLSAEGRELSLRYAEAGDLIGEIAVLDGGVRTADATTVTDVEGFVVAKTALDRIMTERPELAMSFVGVLCGRLRDTTDQLETIALYRLEVRLARFLLSLLRQNGDDDRPRRVVLDLELNQSEIADIIGASRPKVNRAFGDLEEAGAIRRTPEGLICVPDRLAVVAGGG